MKLFCAFIVFLIALSTPFVHAEHMAKISIDGTVFLIPNQDGSKPSLAKKYTLIYGGRKYCGTVSESGKIEVPNIYKICKSNYQSAYRFSKVVKKNHRYFPIGLVVEGCNSVSKKESVPVNDQSIINLKKLLGWSKAYDQQRAYKLKLSENSYLLLEGVYFKEHKTDRLKNITMADVAIIERTSNKVLLKEESRICCNPANFADCAEKSDALKMCTPLSSEINVEGLFKADSKIKAYSIGGISEGAHVFSWDLGGKKRKESFHNYAYVMDGCK